MDFRNVMWMVLLGMVNCVVRMRLPMRGGIGGAPFRIGGGGIPGRLPWRGGPSFPGYGYGVGRGLRVFPSGGRLGGPGLGGGFGPRLGPVGPQRGLGAGLGGGIRQPFLGFPRGSIGGRGLVRRRGGVIGAVGGIGGGVIGRRGRRPIIGGRPIRRGGSFRGVRVPSRGHRISRPVRIGSRQPSHFLGSRIPTIRIPLGSSRGHLVGRGRAGITSREEDQILAIFSLDDHNNDHFSGGGRVISGGRPYLAETIDHPVGIQRSRVPSGVSAQRASSLPTSVGAAQVEDGVLELTGATEEKGLSTATLAETTFGVPMGFTDMEVPELSAAMPDASILGIDTMLDASFGTDAELGSLSTVGDTKSVIGDMVPVTDPVVIQDIAAGTPGAVVGGVVGDVGIVGGVVSDVGVVGGVVSDVGIVGGVVSDVGVVGGVVSDVGVVGGVVSDAGIVGEVIGELGVDSALAAAEGLVVEPQTVVGGAVVTADVSGVVGDVITPIVEASSAAVDGSKIIVGGVDVSAGVGTVQVVGDASATVEVTGEIVGAVQAAGDATVVVDAVPVDSAIVVANPIDAIVAPAADVVAIETVPVYSDVSGLESTVVVPGPAYTDSSATTVVATAIVGDTLASATAVVDTPVIVEEVSVGPIVPGGETTVVVSEPAVVGGTVVVTQGDVAVSPVETGVVDTIGAKTEALVVAPVGVPAAEQGVVVESVGQVIATGTEGIVPGASLFVDQAPLPVDTGVVAKVVSPVDVVGVSGALDVDGALDVGGAFDVGVIGAGVGTHAVDTHATVDGASVAASADAVAIVAVDTPHPTGVVGAGSSDVIVVPDTPVVASAEVSAVVGTSPLVVASETAIVH